MSTASAKDPAGQITAVGVPSADDTELGDRS